MHAKPLNFANAVILNLLKVYTTTGHTTQSTHKQQGSHYLYPTYIHVKDASMSTYQKQRVAATFTTQNQQGSCHIYQTETARQLPHLLPTNSMADATFTKYKQQNSCHICQTETIKQLPYLSDNNMMAATFTKQKQHDSRHIYFPKTAEQISHLPNRNSSRTAATITYQK